MALRRVSDIRPHLVLECSFEQKRFGDKREGEKLGQGEMVKIVGDFFPFLLLSDQASWVKKIQRDSRYEPKP